MKRENAVILLTELRSAAHVALSGVPRERHGRHDLAPDPLRLPLTCANVHAASVASWAIRCLSGITHLALPAQEEIGARNSRASHQLGLRRAEQCRSAGLDEDVACTL